MHLFAFSLICICMEIFQIIKKESVTFPRDSFMLTVMGVFFFLCILEYIFSMFVKGRISVFYSMLPAVLLYLLLKADGSNLLWGTSAGSGGPTITEAAVGLEEAIIAGAAARLLLIAIPRRDAVLRYSIFILDAAAVSLHFSKGILAGDFLTDRILFISLTVLTLSALQKILCERKRKPFPFYYFLLIGALLIAVPMEKDPIDWTPVVRAGESMIDHVAGLADSISYYLSSKFKNGSYAAGYSSMNQAGGKVEWSDSIQLILRTGGDPYHIYRDEETSRNMKIRRELYLAGGRGVDRQAIVSFIRFLHSNNVDREHAALFSKISDVEVEYAYLVTADEIAPCDSILLTSEGKQIESGVSAGMHEKGYTINARYLDIDYGSPYLIDLFRRSGKISQKNPSYENSSYENPSYENLSYENLSYEDACDYVMALYGMDLRKNMTGQAYKEACGESYTDSDLDTGSAGMKVAELTDSILRNAENDYDKCRLIEKYLRQFSYTTNAVGGYDPHSDMSTPEGMSDIAERFLFETRAGYCVHFTSAMVILLRQAGIPARAVSGYRFEFPFEKKDYYEVSSRRAHVWPEAYLAGVGWIPFEPTGAYRTFAEYTWHKKAPESVSEEDDSKVYMPEVPPVGKTETETEEGKNGMLAGIFRIAWPVIIGTLFLLGIVLAWTVGAGSVRYRRGTPEMRLKMDVEMIRKYIRRQCEENFSDRGLLSDYVERAPSHMRDELQRVFDAYYRVIYGNDGGKVSAEENDLARKIRMQLGERERKIRKRKERLKLRK